MSHSISIMGSTGSVGTSALSFIEHVNKTSPDPVFHLEALVAGRNVDLLIEQARQFQPACVVIQDSTHYQTLKAALTGSGIEIASGSHAINEAASRPVHRVLASIVGMDGLASTLAAVRAGNDLALANKESMICAGALLKTEANKSGARLIPTDSEHSAIFQVLERCEDVEKLILTASGGPFRTTDPDQLDQVTPEMALAHPKWRMGRKISIDSATLFNKGLELIEAAYLFDISETCIDIVVHPQSIIHSAVAYRDGSVLAQLGEPDMRIPIAHALTWPDRRQPTAVKPLDLIALSQFDFEAVDESKFSAIRLSRKALRYGYGMPGILNCANECAVAAFLAGKCRFTDISWGVESVMERYSESEMMKQSPDSLEAVYAIEAEAVRLFDLILTERV